MMSDLMTFKHVLFLLKWASLITLILLNANNLYANQIFEYSVYEKIDESELIISGKLYKIFPRKRNSTQQATISVEQILKGKVKSKKILIYTKQGTGEFNTECCSKDDRYVFFLKKNGENEPYYSVDRVYGILKIENDKIKIHGELIEIGELRIKIEEYFQQKNSSK